MQNLRPNLNNISKIHPNNLKKLSAIVLFAFALILRIHHLDFESLWMDEIRQVSSYSNSFLHIVKDAASQAQPPLDYWIGHFVHFISSGDFAARLPAALFGAGSVVMLVLLIAQLCSWAFAYGFGIIYALMPFNLYYSQEARPYAIAIFLFLCMYLVLNSFLSKYKKMFFPVLMLLFLTTIFLYSRSLSPLVVTFSLLLILCCRLIISLQLKTVPKVSPIIYRTILACGTLLVAMVFWLPYLNALLTNSTLYITDNSLGLNLKNLISVIIRFDLAPIWQAYVVQSEPITYPLLFLVCLSPYFGWRLHLYRKNTIWGLTTLLLPIACLLNLIIFQSKSDMPFRAAYANYILPLAIILGAVGLQGLWTLTNRNRNKRMMQAFILALAVIFSFQTAKAAVDFKKMKRKNDWRGVTAYLAEQYNTRHVLVFDTLSHYGSWEPTFFGFRRYYQGQSDLLSIERIPFYVLKMANLSHAPIIILFQWRDYYLTPHSTYPILPVPNPDMQSIDYKKILRDPMLNCKEFTGFSLIRLKEKTDNLGRDSYMIIERLLLHFPKGTWSVELHLAAAALARSNQMDQWSYHLIQAEQMVRGKQLQQVKDVAAYIRRLK